MSNIINIKLNKNKKYIKLTSELTMKAGSDYLFANRVMNVIPRTYLITKKAKLFGNYVSIIKIQSKSYM